MILTVGATGQLGGAITKRLLARGDHVRMLVRRDSPAEHLAQQGLATSPQTLMDLGAEPIDGDLKDPDSLDGACEGVDVVITTANSALRGGDDNPQTVDLDGNRQLIDAAARHGVRQFIFVSAKGASPEHPVPFLQAKGKAEEALKTQGMVYTVIAPEAFMDVWLALVVGRRALSGQPVVVVGSGDRRHSFIASDDVAAFTVAAVGHTDAVNRRLVIGGPEAISFRDAAGVFARILGRDVAVQSVAPGAPIPDLPETMVPMLAGFDMGDSVTDTTELSQTFGVPLTSVDTFARRMAQR